MPLYAVIDVETTGLSPGHHHRVVEVAIVLVDEAGDIRQEWDTLINPQRDVGAGDIHGLTAGDVYDAPLFEEVAGDIAGLLAGRVPVAHNLAFDTGFLIAEYERLGAEIPMTVRSGLCTMQMAGHYFPIPRRSLAACCEYIEYTLTDAHAALADAQATAALLGHYLRRDGRQFPRRWRSHLNAARKAHWPKLPGGVRRPLSRMARKAAAPKHFLARLAEGASPSFVTADAEPYVEALDRALLNRHISRHEADELVSVADALALGRGDVRDVHRRYLHALCVQAWADGVVTAEERADLRRVQQLLGLDSVDLDELLSGARPDPGQGTDMNADLPLLGYVGTFRLEPGDRVVFTGDPPSMSRRQLEERSRVAGLRVTGSVSGRTRLLVAADPDSISSKARRARELRIPIVDAETFMRWMGF